MKVIMLAWGAKVSPEFAEKVILISDRLGIDPNGLMACMAFESAKTFSPSIRNAASGAVGLIQFMPSTAKRLGTSPEALAAMTAEDQLDYVEKYLTPYHKRIEGLEDLYMTILWPLAVGKPGDYILFRDGAAYRQNRGLDQNGDGAVSKAEACASVMGCLAEGWAKYYG